jgi:hypothetical protein
VETIGAIAPAFRKKILSINKVFARYEQHERRLKVMPTQRNRSRSTSHALQRRLLRSCSGSANQRRIRAFERFIRTSIAVRTVALRPCAFGLFEAQYRFRLAGYSATADRQSVYCEQRFRSCVTGPLLGGRRGDAAGVEGV